MAKESQFHTKISLIYKAYMKKKTLVSYKIGNIYTSKTSEFKIN